MHGEREYLCVLTKMCVCVSTYLYRCSIPHLVCTMQGLLDAGIDDDLSHSDFEDDDGSTDIEF